MSGIQDDSYVPVTQEETFEKPSTGSRIMTCLKKFLLAIIAAGLLALLVFQLILISAVGEVKAIDSEVPVVTPAEWVNKVHVIPSERAFGNDMWEKTIGKESYYSIRNGAHEHIWESWQSEINV